jgi:phosphatidylserine/phosphatidylglycerophosphate/cardiolipin synthase-like enzyme
MSLDPARTQRVQADREEQRQREVKHRLRPEDHPGGRIDRHLYDQVRHGPAVPQRNFLHAPRADRLEDREQQQPDRLAER